MIKNFRFICLVLALLMIAGCDKSVSQPAPDEITVQLKWLHQAQFAGFYMALERGYYAQENLKVNFLEGGSNVDITAALLSGKAQFGVVASEVVMIERQKSQFPITAIAAIYQRSATVFVTQKGSGITKPADFAGKKVAALPPAESTGAVEFEYQLKAMVKKLGLNVSYSQLVPYDPTYRGFLDGNIDVTAAYLTSGVIKLRQKGVKLNLIWPGDYGIHFYSDTLVTTEKMVDQRPEIIERFLRATLKGWQQAIGNGKEAVDATLKFTHVQNRQFQTNMLNALRPLVHIGEHQIGWMTAEVWEQMHQVLLDNSILSEPIDNFDEVYTMRFLNAVYGKPKS